MSPTNTPQVRPVAGQWFLPSKDELNQMYINRVAIGGFLNAADYWSSSASPAVAWFQVFGFGSQFYNGKNYTSYVRPVRAFPQATCATGGACAIGETGPGGGKVFYVAAELQPWGRYLEAAPTDYQVDNVRAKVAWGCQGTSTGATATAIGTGKANTATILAKCTTAGIAADVANKYSTTNTVDAPGAAGQWFLPSKDELNQMYINRVAIGGFLNAADYWSSSENRASLAWFQVLGFGSQGSSSKNYTSCVRPVRAF